MTDNREGLRFTYINGQARLTHNGYDITNSVVRFEITADATRVGWVPEIVLHPTIDTIELTTLGQAEQHYLTRVDDNTRDLLVELGWTPPADYRGTSVEHTKKREREQDPTPENLFNRFFGRQKQEPFGDLYRVDNESPDAND